jgi:HD-GYP domain-containing protein (c-di-GMP phosphodiesterase class II)
MKDILKHGIKYFGVLILCLAILAVADVVESMVSHRPYRPAHNEEKALLEIIQGKGTLYHPEVVDACLKLFQEKRFSF